MPFNEQELFQVFARYNAAVWPAQLALCALALATLFTAAFLIQSGLFVWHGVVQERINFPSRGIGAAFGTALIAYALIAYPLLLLIAEPIVAIGALVAQHALPNRVGRSAC